MTYKKHILVWILSLVALRASSMDRQNMSAAHSKSGETKEYIYVQAKQKISQLNLNETFQNARLVLVARYDKEDIKAYDSIGLLNYQLTFSPIMTLKGIQKEDKVYIHVHSPARSGFGHQENFGKRFILFLTDDKFEDGHYAEGIDFTRSVLLE